MFSTGFSPKNTTEAHVLYSLSLFLFIYFILKWHLWSKIYFLISVHSLIVSQVHLWKQLWQTSQTLHTSECFLHHCIQISPSRAPVQLWLQQSCSLAWFSSCPSRYSGFVSLGALFCLCLNPLNTRSVPDPKLLAISVGNLMHFLGFHCHLRVGAAHRTISDYSPLLECNQSISSYRLPHSNPCPISTSMPVYPT